MKAPLRERIPIYTAGVNPRMIESAGRVADGLLGHALFTAEHIAEVVRPAIAKGAAHADRDPAEIAVATLVISVVDERRRAGAPRGRRPDRLLLLGEDLRGAARLARLRRRRGGDPRGLRRRRLGRDGRRRHRRRWSTAWPSPGPPDEVKAAARRYEGILDHLILYAPSYGISAERAVENANRLVATFGDGAMSARPPPPPDRARALRRARGDALGRGRRAATRGPTRSSSRSRRSASTSATRWSAAASTGATSRSTSPPASRPRAGCVEDPSGELEVGQRVIVFNDNGRGYADLLVVPRQRVFAVPDDVDPTVLAAIFIQGTTAWYSLYRFGYVARGRVGADPRRRRRRRRRWRSSSRSPPGRGRSPPPRPRRSSRSPAATAPSTRSSPTPRPSPPRSAS